MKNFKILFKPIDLLWLLVIGAIFLILWLMGVPFLTYLLAILAAITFLIFLYIEKWQLYSKKFLIEFANKYNFASKNVTFQEYTKEIRKKSDIFASGINNKIEKIYYKDNISYYFFYNSIMEHEVERYAPSGGSSFVIFIVFDFLLNKSFEPVAIFNRRESFNFKIAHHRTKLTTESNEFNKLYWIYADNLKSVYNFLNPTIMSLLLDIKIDLNIEVVENRLLIYKCGKPSNLETLEKIYGLGVKIKEIID